VRKNEVLAIIGPSGSGKTTLLRLIAGVESVDGGKITVAGKVGMVFQNGFLWPHKTVLENIVEPLVRVKRMARREAEEKAFAVMDKFGLRPRANDYPETLSGGEAQRAAIARSLVMEPEILLLDEITSSLDPVLVGEVLRTLRKLASEKRTLVIVTHELNFAKEVSDRVAFLDGGKIVESGHPAVIFGNPADERTSLFVNSINER
jgi:ABC-type polar amino acid transport system ATPase subunit